MVAQRQGRDPQVLLKRYRKRRLFVDRKSAEHLGRAVHGRASRGGARGNAPKE
jgi:hypothetical protein